MASCVPAILLILLPICWLSGGHWTLLWKWLWLPKVHPGQIAFWLSPRLHICRVSAGLGGGMVDLGTWNKGQMQLKVGLTQQGKSLYLTYEDINKFNSALHQLCGVLSCRISPLVPQAWIMAVPGFSSREVSSYVKSWVSCFGIHEKSPTCFHLPYYTHHGRGVL